MDVANPKLLENQKVCIPACFSPSASSFQARWVLYWWNWYDQRDWVCVWLNYGAFTLALSLVRFDDVNSVFWTRVRVCEPYLNPPKMFRFWVNSSTVHSWCARNRTKSQKWTAIDDVWFDKSVVASQMMHYTRGGERQSRRATVLQSSAPTLLISLFRCLIRSKIRETDVCHPCTIHYAQHTQPCKVWI